jgi:hypothetical protein
MRSKRWAFLDSVVVILLILLNGSLRLRSLPWCRRAAGGSRRQRGSYEIPISRPSSPSGFLMGD